MEIKKSLVKAIAAGLTVGTCFTACSTFDSVIPEEEYEKRVVVEETTEDGGEICWENCPACGLG
jgi:hypothetical protein